jgi:hypothetical protein
MIKAEVLQQNRSIGKYIPQRPGVSSHRLVSDSIREIMACSFGFEDKLSEVPDLFRIVEPKGIVHDRCLVSNVMRYLAQGLPAISLVGPTGSGKSMTAEFISARMNTKGYAVMVIDGNERTEGDNLFHRIDFTEKGTYTLKGTLCAFAEETKKLGLNAIVIADEYNAFSDATRREFYRLFNRHNRVYKIEDPKTGLVGSMVDFNHVQFILTGNPVEDRYLVDDIRPFSNAECRRITFIRAEMSEDKVYVQDVTDSIIKNMAIYESLDTRYKDYVARKDDGKLKTGEKEPMQVEGLFDLELAWSVYKLLVLPDKEGRRLEHDFGYSDIADWLWSMGILGYTPEAWCTASEVHLLNPVKDYRTRQIIALRIKQEFGQDISPELTKQAA